MFPQLLLGPVRARLLVGGMGIVGIVVVVEGTCAMRRGIIVILGVVIMVIGGGGVRDTPPCGGCIGCEVWGG